MRTSLMMTSVSILLLFVFVSIPTPLFAQEDDEMPPVSLIPPTIPFKDIDLNGTWNYKISKPTVSGRCPAGSAMAGTAIITQQGSDVTLKYTSGAKCRPAAVCSYAGALEDPPGEGRSAILVVSNAVDVDDEGGTVSSAIRLTVYTNELAAGEGTNEYVHPEGFQCRWSMDVRLTREQDEKEKEE
jgi:hypothetical protein